MRNCLYFSLLLFVFFSFSGYSQKKTLQTQFCDEKITIDGKFDEAIWKKAKIASNFEMIAPDNGKPEDSKKKSEVKIVYDNEAIYVAATLYDDEPTQIKKELTTRDNFVSADHFGIFLNGFNDGQQELRFFVSAAGVQADVLYTDSNGEDLTWNSIWASEVKITDFGWVVEMKIPYAALRFSSENKQTWGLNFYREIFRVRQQFTWNLISNNIPSESNQAGILEGIENIQTPTRLFLIPYVSQYFNGATGQKTLGKFKGGLDIKYGINDAFTLDAILVPDFGQTAFDKVELNQGPFEQQFNENRPFFTEGTELFSKGNLLYTRRIGGSPSRFPNLERDANDEEIEEVTKYPSNVNLLNALKVSGRTKEGLGIGILNAITQKTKADIHNNVNGEDRQEVIESLANYNVFVLDQRFRKNSSVSFINTNVMRNGDFQDANVSAAVFDLNTRKNTFNLNGDFKYSYVNPDKYYDRDAPIREGINTSLNFQKTSGKNRFGCGTQFVSKDFDSNDLGINFQTHYAAYYANYSYRILKPTKTFNSFNVYNNLYTEFDNRTGRIQAASINININSTSKKNDYYGGNIGIRPVEVSDFYEPRTFEEQKYLTLPEFVNAGFYFSSNYNRKFALDLNPTIAIVNEKGRWNYGCSISPRYRFSDKFALVYEYAFNNKINNIGFAGDDEKVNEIYMGRRDIKTNSSSLTGKYSINNVMTINLTSRYYWSYWINNKYYTLQDDGGLVDNASYMYNYDKNFSTWNTDLSFSWWFAPGSQMSVLYRNSAGTYEEYTSFDTDFNNNFNRLLKPNNINHSFSISVRYFIDYNDSKHWFSKK